VWRNGTGTAAGLGDEGLTAEEGATVAHWSQVLSDVSLVEFTLLAVLTTGQWVRHRVRGVAWVVLTFAIVAALSLVLKVDPSIVTNQNVTKALVALLLVTPYCFFRFAVTFSPPSPGVRLAALAVTVVMVAFTLTLSSVPVSGAPPPPHFLAYRITFGVAFGFLFAYVVLRLFLAGRGQPPIAASRMHLLAIAVAGLEVQVVVVALGLRGDTVTLLTQALTVAMGLVFLVALVLPSFVRVLLSRREDTAFRDAVGQLVSAGDSQDVAEHLLPHVCALVGATEAALLSSDGTVVARYPVWVEGASGDWEADVEPRGPNRRITVRTASGATHSLAVRISPYMPYFGSEELHKLDQLASMVGLAIERCEQAEQMAHQASHDGLTGLANRALFMERLEEALQHVGRRRSSLALLFIDLDRFKLVNDRSNHAAGDSVLNEMADRLTTMTRGVDVVARFGGDEFVAFAEVDTEGDAVEMAERIRAGLGAPVAVGEVHLVVTASIGVVVTSKAGASPADLLRDADNAMYEAKRHGRNQVVVYKPYARDVANLKWGLRPSRSPRLSAS
jgi:diguanylate cyclase (GGDEF)-like protein